MHRDVVEDAYFSDEFDLFRNAYDHMDDVHAAVTWTLGANPRLGTLIEGFPHPTIRFFKTTPIGKTPRFRILYRFTSEQVILLAIEVDLG